MYALEIREHLDKAFRKLAKKDATLIEAMAKKIKEIVEDPHAYKPLRFPLAGKRRCTSAVTSCYSRSMRKGKRWFSRIMSITTESIGRSKASDVAYRKRKTSSF